MNALVPQISSMCTCTVPLPGEFAASTPAIEGAEAANWYAYREKITSVTIRLTGAKDLSGMFAVCKYMESVDLSGLQTDRRSCQKTIYTPFNVNVDVPLHGEKDSNVWRGVISGEQKELTEMVKRQHLFPGIKRY